MKDLYLIACIAGEEVAIKAEYVESVVKVSDIVPVPLSPDFVCGLCALRSRVLTIIDMQYFVTGQVLDLTAEHNAIVMEHDGNNYGMLVDSVQDVVAIGIEAEPLRGAAHAGWAQLADQMIAVDGKTLLMVEPHRLLENSPRLAA